MAVEAFSSVRRLLALAFRAFVLCGLYWLCDHDGEYLLAIEPATAILIAGGLSAAGGIGGSLIASSSQPSARSPSDLPGSGFSSDTDSLQSQLA